VRQDELFAEQALRPAYERQSHTDTLPRSSGVAVTERVFPVLFIVSWHRHAGATSLSLVAAENQVLAWYAGQLSHFVNWRRSTLSTEPVEYGWWLEKRIRTIEAFAPPTGVVKRHP
jgi:hypothetical protein